MALPRAGRTVPSAGKADEIFVAKPWNGNEPSFFVADVIDFRLDFAAGNDWARLRGNRSLRSGIGCATGVAGGQCWLGSVRLDRDRFFGAWTAVLSAA